MKEPDNQLHAMRHSMAHIMAAALQSLYPSAQFGVGPVIEHGFYYDVKLNQPLSDKELPKLKKAMHKIITADLAIERFEMPIDLAIQYFKDNNQPYKVELLQDLQQHGTTSLKDIPKDDVGIDESVEKVTTVSLYRIGDFTDLCRGPHLERTGQAGAFKLDKLAGAYWRGDEKRDQLQRIYGLAFAQESELEEHLKMVEEAVKRDHRKIGRELDLFTFSDQVGSGLPLFTPRGTYLRELLNTYSQELRLAEGFEKVWVPHLTKKNLYETSGHWDKFGGELLLVTSQETSDELILKPMNCPHHQQIYASQPRSYRDLPIKYMETTTVYRDEKSGELNGLSRVRSITQDDSHTFCTPDQIEEVLGMLTRVTKHFYATLGMTLRARLSYRDDTDGYLGDPELWERAQSILRKVAEKEELDFYEVSGEAAFYGPKIDFMARDALGREHQLATPQLDFVQPERFGLTYTAADGTSQTPVMIHYALMGSIERFLSVYLEHTAGHFPVWVAPEQVRIVPVSEKVATYAVSVQGALKDAGIRVRLDDDNESLGKRIRAAEMFKVPYVLVLGEREAEAGEVAVRQAKVGDQGTMKLDAFVEKITSQISSRE